MHIHTYICTQQREEEERVRTRREAFLKSMQEKEKRTEERKAGRLKPPGNGNANNRDPNNKEPGSIKREANTLGPNANNTMQKKDIMGPPQAPGRENKGEPVPVQRIGRPPVAGGDDGSDPVSDIINGMPKSGKYVVKKDAAFSENNSNKVT